MSCSNVKDEYNNGVVGQDYSFTFEYEDQAEVHVAQWMPDDLQFKKVERDTWKFQNATTIRFTTAPNPGPFIIYRETDIEEMEVTFYPGASIKAGDLNLNFEQLQHALQELGCFKEEFYEYLDEYIWDKRDAITYDEQINGPSAKVNDDHIFTASAIAARHDNLISDNRPAVVPVEQPGKIWNDTDDLQDYFWDPTANAWVSFTKSGPAGPAGPYGPPGKVIIADNPPMMYPAVGDNEARELESGDLWWDSNRVLLYVYYTDTNSSQWVAVSKTGPQGEPGEPGPTGGIDDAPDDGTLYGRQNGQWVEAQEPLTFTAPLVKDNSNDVAFVWASMTSLP